MPRFGRLLPSIALLLFLPKIVAAEAAGAQPTPGAPSTTASSSDTEARLKALEAKLQELAAAVEALRRQSEPPGAARMADLEKQIDALTREIEALKLGEAAAPTAGASLHGLGPAASKVYKVREGVSLGGYGEMVYRDFGGRSDSGALSGEGDRLDLARAVFYFGYKWNERILFNSEIEFEHATTGEGDEVKGEVSVEFAHLDFLVRKGFNVRAGLILVPLGILNEMHEPTTFPGVLRTRVETLILPTTWRENGAGVFGETRWLSYRAYLVAGLDARGFSAEEGIREGRQGGSESLANNFALTGRLDLTPVPGLLAGVSAYSGDSGQGQIPSDARVLLIDVHVHYQWHGFEGSGLWTRGAIADVDQIDRALGILPGSDASVGGHLKGWYLEGSWDLLSIRESHKHALAPFLRFEALDTQESVPSGFVENRALDQRIWTLGLLWKPVPQVAVKADYQDVDNGAGSGVDEFHVGLGWIF